AVPLDGQRARVVRLTDEMLFDGFTAGRVACEPVHHGKHAVKGAVEAAGHVARDVCDGQQVLVMDGGIPGGGAHANDFGEWYERTACGAQLEGEHSVQVGPVRHAQLDTHGNRVPFAAGVHVGCVRAG